MTHPLLSSKYVGLNLKLFHNLLRNRRITVGKRINFSTDSYNKYVIKDNQQGNGKNDKRMGDQEKREYPEEPTTCCMSGCANCVWLDYAEKLSEYYRDAGEQAMKDINEKITDENLKAFLLLELRMRNKK